jgi:hypothetical protein
VPGTPSLESGRWADGWILLRRQYNVPVRVHLVTRLFASPRDHLADATDQVSPDHFQAFIAQVLEPLRREALAFQWRYRTLPTSIPSQDPRVTQVIYCRASGQDNLKRDVVPRQNTLPVRGGQAARLAEDRKDAPALQSAFLTCLHPWWLGGARRPATRYPGELATSAEMIARGSLDLRGSTRRLRRHPAGR